MIVDFDHVTQIIRRVAAEEIMPRFQKLAAGDIMEKSPGDLVTTADIKAEFALTQHLKECLPNSHVIGEEAASRTPDILSLLSSSEPIWIVDPVDGTRNFTQGNNHFGSIVALIYRHQVIGGWIHDPVRDQTAVIRKGEGVTLNNTPITVSFPEIFEELIIRLNLTDRKAVSSQAPILTNLQPRHGACAHDYLSFLSGKTHAVHFKGTLYPWDHAAGCLMMKELGFYLKLIRPDQITLDYAPHVHPQTRLLITPTEKFWQPLNTLLTPKETAA